MSNRDIALEYVRRFCAADIDGLARLLAPELSFKGTFHAYRSAADYIDSLRSDPPVKCGYKVLSLTEGEGSVAVFYEYRKPDRTMTIAQLFRIADDRINDVLLIFDGRDNV
jgi:hypothetical protein